MDYKTQIDKMVAKGKIKYPTKCKDCNHFDILHNGTQQYGLYHCDCGKSCFSNKFQKLQEEELGVWLKAYKILKLTGKM